MAASQNNYSQYLQIGYKISNGIIIAQFIALLKTFVKALIKEMTGAVRPSPLSSPCAAMLVLADGNLISELQERHQPKR
jgi:hypothetical protein